MNQKETINICFSQSLEGVLKDFNRELKILSIPISFDIGNLQEIENLEFQVCLDPYVENEINIRSILDKLEYLVASTTLKNFVIWYSEDSNEYCGMLYVLYKLRKTNNKNIYLINGSDVLYLNNLIIDIKRTSEITKEFIPLTMKKIKRINNIEKQNYIAEFKQNFNKKGTIRLYNSNYRRILNFSYSELVPDVYFALETKYNLEENILLIRDKLSYSYNIAAHMIEFLEKNNMIEIREGMIVKII
ncbi:DUF1835 domain-containing protein [Peptoniphilus sp. AGMB00490]|uniref:DUF1835 domain-containing protein n=2 Tax=Peptoniphilus TaxID=162289 RepID=A0ACD6AZF3_9FIRM|nr:MULTISPECIES: DUF1835 domain-containing protein [Peptoniphilus]NMW84528.1 DUF1835 domain-containing protein [Peptoniphilus faecalis]OLR64914.1 hypothetical protein BIV18_04980 [Peptoniphilus porci]